MFHTSIGQSRRPKGFNVKKAVQISLLLAVSIWLLYQIKNSRFKSNKYSITSENKVSGKVGSLVLGRKGNAGSSNGDEMDLDDGEGKGKEDGGDGDDELDRNSEERVRQESLHKKHEDSEENVTDREVKGNEEAETQQEESQSKEEDDMDAQVNDGGEVIGSDNKKKNSKGKADGNIANHEETKDEKHLTKHEKELQKHEGDSNDIGARDESEALGSGKVEDLKVNAVEARDGNEELGSDKNEDTTVHAMSPDAEMDSTGFNSQIEAGTGVNDFHDENGIPPDETTLVSRNQTLVSGETLLEAKTTSSSQLDNGNDVELPTDNKVIKKPEIKSYGRGNASQTESATNSTQVGLEIGVSTDLETGSEAADRVDELSINGISTATQKMV